MTVPKQKRFYREKRLQSVKNWIQEYKGQRQPWISETVSQLHAILPTPYDEEGLKGI